VHSMVRERGARSCSTSRKEVTGTGREEDTVSGSKNKFHCLYAHNTCIYKDVYVCMCVYIYIYIYTHRHTHTHTDRHGSAVPKTVVCRVA